jgi:hypothetical protein
MTSVVNVVQPIRLTPYSLPRITKRYQDHLSSPSSAPAFFPVTTDEPALREYLFKRSAENIRNESKQQKKPMEFKFPFVLA